MLSAAPRYWGPGLVLIALGEALRLWAVGHIGRKSRTRGEEVGSLAVSGPYARLRNPLYLGNLLIFSGLGVVQWPWVLAVAPLMAWYYQQIIRWEEHNLQIKIGPAYGEYQLRVPRWGWGKEAGEPHPWDGREALRSERSTLLALGITLLVVWARS